MRFDVELDCGDEPRPARGVREAAELIDQSPRRIEEPLAGCLAEPDRDEIAAAA